MELKRGVRVRVQREIVIHSFAVPFSSQLTIWPFQVLLVETAKKCIKRRDARAELLFSHKTYCSLDVPVAVTVVVS